MQSVVEGHFAVSQLILEMDIGGWQMGIFGNLSEGKVVRTDQSHRIVGEERTDDGVGPHSPVVGIGAVQNLIQEKEERRGFEKKRILLRSLV